jgi:hypothetical protein
MFQGEVEVTNLKLVLNELHTLEVIIDFCLLFVFYPAQQ